MSNKGKGNAVNAISGMIWSFAERISAQMVTLLVSILLARMLSPDEYAVVAIVMVFVTIANVFVTSGFGSALVQKIDADNIDFSSTLYFSLGFALLCYAALYFGAPYIASFYNMQILIPVVRVLSLRLVLAAVNSIQQAYVAKHLQFKKFFLSTLVGTVASAVVGVGMAFAGYGVWALVMQYLTNVTINTVVLGITSGWKPQLVFSWTRMRSLFSYGWKIMVSDVINKGCEQTRNLLLGKFASPVDLSYYEQGQKFPALVINNVETSIQKVLAPIVSNAQNDKQRVLDLTRKSIRVSTFVIWPVLVGMAAIGNSFIELLYTSKWAGCVPYLQVVCLAYMFYPVGETHIRTIKALGKSGAFLVIMILSQTIGLGCLITFILLKLDAMWIVFTWIISTALLAAFAGILTRKYVRYKLRYQAADLLPTLVCCTIMGLAVLPMQGLSLPTFPLLCLQVIVGVCVYTLISYILNKKTVLYVISTVMRYGKAVLKR